MPVPLNTTIGQLCSALQQLPRIPVRKWKYG